jgi:hypothetical protein
MAEGSSTTTTVNRLSAIATHTLTPVGESSEQAAVCAFGCTLFAQGDAGGTPLDVAGSC